MALASFARKIVRWVGVDIRPNIERVVYHYDGVCLELAPLSGRIWTRDSSGGSVFLLEVERGHLAERGVPAAGFVPGLDEVEDGLTTFGLITEALPLHEFGLERREEALAHGVVVGISDRAHVGSNAALLAA